MDRATPRGVIEVEKAFALGKRCLKGGEAASRRGGGGVGIGGGNAGRGRGDSRSEKDKRACGSKEGDSAA